MWKAIKINFRRGVVALLPVVVPIILLGWLLAKAESLFDDPIMWIMDLFVEDLSQSYQWWFGLIVSFAFIFGLSVLIGWGLRIWAVKKTFSLINFILGKLPLAKLLYGSIKNLAESLDPDKERQLGKPVAINLDPEGKIRVMGFVTNESCSDFPGGINPLDSCVSYVPFAGNMGGWTIIASDDRVEDVDMLPIDAFTFAFTAGMTSPTKKLNRTNTVGSTESKKPNKILDKNKVNDNENKE